MNHIALHILQPFPATCLNRDDVGTPKTLRFGGVTRARVSSQCWKRAIRLEARKSRGDLFGGERTRCAAEPLARSLQSLKVPEAELLAQLVCESFLSKKAAEGAQANPEGEDTDGDDEETSGLLYFSPGEIAAIATDLAQLDPAVTQKALARAPADKKAAVKEMQKAQKAVQETASNAAKAFSRKDAADISIFGRMVANDHSLNIEGAGLFAHAFSTHKCDNDIDFWTAVDDRKEDQPGASNLGYAEFNAACYYRYLALNLDLLANAGHLGPIGRNGRRQVVCAFLRAALFAVPSARQNGMNGSSLPEFVLGLVASGQPFQLANAFESPVRPEGTGWLKPSTEALERHFAKLKAVFGLQSAIREEVRLCEETPLDRFIEALAAHVH
jgi:CRISPR system Cascade subunit CasC